jgi:hypothetical protein
MGATQQRERRPPLMKEILQDTLSSLNYDLRNKK